MTAPLNSLRVRSLVTAIAAAVLIVAQGAAFAHEAQKPIEDGSQVGTRFKQKPRTANEASQRQLMNYVALCVQKSVPQRTDWFLRNSDDRAYVHPQGSHDIGTYLVFDQCLGDTMNDVTSELGVSTSTSAMRGLLAEQAYLAARKTYEAPAPDAPPMPERVLVATGEALPVARGLAQFEDCIATDDPADADALLRTQPGGPAELDAARALAPTLGKCLPQGQTISFTAQNVRSIAAEGMWQRFVAPNAPSYTGQP